MTQQLANLALQQIEFVLKEAAKNQETNEQWFLNFLDELNKLSITY